MREKDELDLLLDSALSTYADPGRDSGLEERVLAALSAARESKQRDRFIAPPRRRWLPWVIALPAAACLLLLWLATSRIKHVPSTETQQARQVNQAPALPRTTPLAEVRSKSPKGREQRATSGYSAASKEPQPATQLSGTSPVPKLDVFPTPQPLTEEERALAVVATQTPAPVRNALLEAQIQNDAPVRIAAIHIPPIESPDQGQP